MRTVLIGTYSVRQRTLASRLSTKIAQDPEYCKQIGIEDASRYREAGREEKEMINDAEHNYGHYSTDSLL